MAAARRKTARKTKKTTIRVSKTKAKTKTKTTKKTTRKTTKTTVKNLKLKKTEKAYTTSQQIGFLSDATGVAKKDVKSIIENLLGLITGHLNGPGSITLGGLLKIKVVRKPATKARKGINPFTGEPTTFKAKPARNVVKITALKKLKDAV